MNPNEYEIWYVGSDPGKFLPSSSPNKFDMREVSGTVLDIAEFRLPVQLRYSLSGMEKEGVRNLFVPKTEKHFKELIEKHKRPESTEPPWTDEECERYADDQYYND